MYDTAIATGTRVMRPRPFPPVTTYGGPQITDPTFEGPLPGPSITSGTTYAGRPLELHGIDELAALLASR